VLNNLSLQLNPVLIYQILKTAVTPILVAIEAVVYGKRISCASTVFIAVLCIGITLATVSGDSMRSTRDSPALGITVGIGSAVTSALYQIWAGTKQRDLGLSGTQLVYACAPTALVILTALVPCFDPLGSPRTFWRVFGGPQASEIGDGTVFGFTYTLPAMAAILLSSVLGLLVTVSTMIWIGLTSSLTYNVVGHIKTVAIVLFGVLLFGDEVSGRCAAGLTIAMTGIAGYSWLQVTSKEDMDSCPPDAPKNDAPSPRP